MTDAIRPASSLPPYALDGVRRMRTIAAENHGEVQTALTNLSETPKFHETKAYIGELQNKLGNYVEQGNDLDVGTMQAIAQKIGEIVDGVADATQEEKEKFMLALQGAVIPVVAPYTVARQIEVAPDQFKRDGSIPAAMVAAMGEAVPENVVQALAAQATLTPKAVDAANNDKPSKVDMVNVLKGMRDNPAAGASWFNAMEDMVNHTETVPGQKGRSQRLSKELSKIRTAAMDQGMAVEDFVGEAQKSPEFMAALAAFYGVGTDKNMNKLVEAGLKNFREHGGQEVLFDSIRSNLNASKLNTRGTDDPGSYGKRMDGVKDAMSMLEGYSSVEDMPPEKQKEFMAAVQKQAMAGSKHLGEPPTVEEMERDGVPPGAQDLIRQNYRAQKTLNESNQDTWQQIGGLLNSGMPIEAVLIMVMLLLTKNQEDKLKFKMEEVRISERLKQSQESGELPKDLDFSKYDIRASSTTTLMNEMQVEMQMFSQYMNAFSSVLRQVQDLVNSIIQKIR